MLFEMPRTTHTKEERIAVIDAKIEKHKKDIKTLEAKKQAILNPKPRKARTTAKTVVDLAKKAGMKPEEMLEKLGLKIED